MTGSVPAEFTIGGRLKFTGSITGTPPPGMWPIDVGCILKVVSLAGPPSAGAFNNVINVRDFGLVVETGAMQPGPATWTITCQATGHLGSESASGTFTLLPREEGITPDP